MKEVIAELIEILGKPTDRRRVEDGNLAIRWKETRDRRGFRVLFFTDSQGTQWCLYDIIEGKGSVGASCRPNEVCLVAQKMAMGVSGLVIVIQH